MRHLCFILFCISILSTSGQGFVDVSYFEGIHFTYDGGELGGGVSFADWDQDGWDDLSFCQNATELRFYRNNAGNGFVNTDLGIPNNGEVKMISWVDFDNDGDRDLFLTTMNMPHRLYRRDGAYTFTDVSSTCGLAQDSIQKTYGHAWGDYDLDGYLDLYICNYNGPVLPNPTVKSYLYHNNGNGTFEDVTSTAGVPNSCAYAFQALWNDYDHDLDPDLFIVNDRTSCPNVLYRNNGDGTFTDKSNESGVGQFFIFAMSATGGDYDNDDDIDLYVTNNTAGNLLLRNEDNGTYTEDAIAAGVAVNDFTWSAQFLDYDNDGWQDLHIACSPNFNNPGQNKFYRNNGNGTFSNYLNQAGLVGDNGWSRSSAQGDYNHDGFPDIVVSQSLPDSCKLWKSIPTENHWIGIDLHGVMSNSDGIGSWIECYSENASQSRFTFCGESYLSQNSFTELFGLGSASAVDSLTVHWPSGLTETWFGLETDQYLTLTEGSTLTNTIHVLGSSVICPGEAVSLYAGAWSSYLWSTGSTEPTIEVTEPGNYTVAVTNSLGFSIESDESEISWFQPAIPSATFQSCSCSQSSDGWIQLTLGDGTEIAQVMWSNFMQGTFIEDLPAGYYSYVLTDANGCDVPGTVHIGAPLPLAIFELQMTDPICFGMNGSAICDATGGSPPYLFNWGGFNSAQIPAGIHEVLVTDNHGCESSEIFEINSPTQIEIALTTTDASYAFGNGSACSEATGGTPPYTYLWSSGDITPCAEDLPAGPWTISVSDLNDCVVFSSTEVGYNTVVENETELLRFYPNPATDHLIIQSDPSLKTLVCTDEEGRIVLHFDLQGDRLDHRIDLSSLPSGIYHLEASGIDPFTHFGAIFVKE